MKVIEIIHNDQLDEGLGTAARYLAGKLFGTVSAEVVEKAIKVLASKGRLAGAATREEAVRAIERLGPKAKEVLAKDPKIADYVLKQANKVRDPGIMRRAGQSLGLGGRAAMKGASKSASVAAKSVKWLATVGVNWVYYKQFYDPLELYLNNVEIAEEKMKAGEVTQDEFDAYRQQEMSVLVGKWAALFAAGALARMPFKVFTRMIGATNSKLGQTLSLVGKAGAAAVMEWVNNGENSKDIAEFMAQPLVTWGAGGLGVTFENKLRSIIPFARKIDSGEATSLPATGSTGAQGSQGAGDEEGDEADDTDTADAEDNVADVDSETIMKMQQELKAAGADLGTFGPKGDGVDGKIGTFTSAAMKAKPQIAAKYGLSPTGEPLPKQPTASPSKPATPVNPAQSQKDKDEADPKNWVPVPGKPDYVKNIKTGTVDWADAH